MNYWMKFMKIELAIFLLAALLDVLSKNITYTGALFALGTILLIYITYSEIGAWLVVRSPIYLYGSTVGIKSMAEDRLDTMSSATNSVWDLLEALPVGLFPIVIGAIANVLRL